MNRLPYRYIFLSILLLSNFACSGNSGSQEPLTTEPITDSMNEIRPEAESDNNTSDNTETQDNNNSADQESNQDSTNENPIPTPRFSNPSIIYDGEATTVQWGDIDSDGDMDLFVAEGGKHYSGTPTLSWFEYPGWHKHEIGQPLEPFTGDSQLVDLDFDGDLDLVISVDSHSAENNTGALFWYENTQSHDIDWPRHVVESNIPDAYHIGDIVVGDVDANGLMDIVVRHLSTYRFVVYFQTTKDNWKTKRIDTRDREGLAIADLNNDGLLDIIGNGYVLFAPPEPMDNTWIEVIIDPEFFNKREISLNNSVKVNTADMDSDGNIDVIFSPAEGEAVYFAWYEVPDQPLTGIWKKHIIESPLSNNHQVQFADVDLDGDLDLLGGFSFGDNGVVWWENTDGRGNSFIRHTIDSENGCYSCRVADFDNDGDWDFAGPTKYVGQIYLYENLTANTAGPLQD